MSKFKMPPLGEMLHIRGKSLNKGDPVAPPLVTSSMYHIPGSPEGYPGYGRISNPTREHLEETLSHLEGAPCLSFPSGMAAITAALFAVLGAGKRVLIPSDGYYVTRRLAERFLKGFDVEVTERPTARFVEGGFDEFDVVFLESPSNPGLDVIDLEQVAREVTAAGGITIADNTTLTPLGQRPLDLGVDVVVASDTKAMGGHSDLLMGHVASRDPDILASVLDWRNMSGAIPGSHDAWLLQRGLETLDVRYDRMCRSAGILAEQLSSDDRVASVRYPGLVSDPSFTIASKQMQRFGFVLSLTLADEKTAETFINSCPLLRPATSFGGVHSSAERRARWGDDVAPGFIRLSIGCEPVDELSDAFDRALAEK